jgi:plastocyanin
MPPKIFAIGCAGLAVLAATPGRAETIRVEVDRASYAPAQVTAHVGDTIEWVSKDFLAHTATARNKDFDLSLPANATGRVVLTHAGEIDYFCRYHPNMAGRITVEK